MSDTDTNTNNSSSNAAVAATTRYEPKRVPESCIPIPDYPDFALDPDTYLIWRTKPSKKGHRSGEVYPLNPCIHPRGRLWSVMMVNFEGKRKRVAISKVIRELTGETDTPMGRLEA